MKNEVGLELLTNAIVIMNNIKSESIMTINHEGYCTIYIAHQLAFESINSVNNFSFRGYEDPNDTDGLDFWNVNNDEINYLLTLFKFKHVDLG